MGPYFLIIDCQLPSYEEVYWQPASWLGCYDSSFQSGKMRLHNSLNLIQKKCATYTYILSGRHAWACLWWHQVPLLVDPATSQLNGETSEVSGPLEKKTFLLLSQALTLSYQLPSHVCTIKVVMLKIVTALLWENFHLCGHCALLFFPAFPSLCVPGTTEKV